MTITTFASFGGVGNDSTDNATAFASAESSSAERIWLEEGIYYTTTAQSALTKFYWGPGRIRLSSGNFLPGRTTWIATEPSQYSPQGPTGWFRGDTSRVEPEWITLGAFRKGLTERYYEETVIPHNRWFDNNAGWSGISARLALDAAKFATSATLNSVDGFSAGQTVGFFVGPTGPGVGETFNVTITAVNATTKMITFTPGLDKDYAASSVVTHGIRTNHTLHYDRVRHYGGGDGYGDVKRTQARYVKLAGQTHFFETSTVGMYGGDAYIFANGNYLTGNEMHFFDHSAEGTFDGAVIGDTKAFDRNEDTGALSVVWLGNFYQSGGMKPVDAGFVFAGKYRIGIDFARADLSTWLSASDGYNAAISMAKGQRIVMGSTASNAGRGGSANYGPVYGNTPGDMFIESGADGTSDYISLRFNRGAGSNGQIRLRPNSLNFNVPVVMDSYLITGGDVAIPSSGLVVFGAGTGNYLSKSGGSVYWNNAGTAYRVALVGIDV